MTTKIAASIKTLARAAFPEYKGRKIKTAQRASYTMSNFWDGGSRTFVKAVNLATGKMVDPSELTANPMNGAAHATFQIPAGIAIVEHSFFCGQDCGLTVVTAAPVAIECGAPVGRFACSLPKGHLCSAHVSPKFANPELA